MHQDNYGLELSCANAAACAAYLAGVDNALRLDQSGIDELSAAVELDPGFALAHAALARQLQIHGLGEAVGKHLRLAESSKSSATQRERRAIDVVVSAVTFQEDTLALASAHIGTYPRDVFVLAHIIGPFGLLAFSGQPDWREENVAILSSLEKAFPENDWWYLSSRSFLASEVNDLVGARSFGERAWDLSENGNTAHSIAHLHSEERAIFDGKAFITGWIESHGGQSDMRHHLVWHFALLLREEGADASELLAIFENELDPLISDPMPLSTFSDNASLLWRCHLSGLEVAPSVCRDLVDYADRHYPNLGFVFADIHRVMATGLLDSIAQRDLLKDLIQLAGESGSPITEAMVRFAEGFFAFANRDFATAVERLKPVVADSVLLGGSNPQRRIIEETYQAAERHVV